MKKVLSVFLSFVMLLSVTTGLTFTAQATQTISAVEMGIYTTPTAGQKPRFSTDLVGNTYGTAYKISKTFDSDEEKIYGGISWYDNNTGVYLGKDDTFTAGHVYTVSIYLYSLEGYEFAYADQHTPTVTARFYKANSAYYSYSANVAKVPGYGAFAAIRMFYTYSAVGEAPAYSGNCGLNGANATWEYYSSAKTLYIKGNGAIDNYTDQKGIKPAPWTSYNANIEAVVIDEGITVIGTYAFLGCGCSLVQFPRTLTRVGDYAFAFCPNLTKIKIYTDQPCVIDADAFESNKATDTKIYLDGVTEINDSAFYERNASVVDLGNDIQKISTAAFHGNYTIESITIPASCTLVDVGAFNDCPKLKTVKIMNATCALESACFNEGATICGFDGSTAQALVNANPTKFTFASLNSGMSGECPWTFDYATGTLTVHAGGSGMMADYGYSSYAPWYEYENLIKTIVIENGVTIIGAYAFYNCENIESVSIPASVTKIGTASFKYCENLKSLVIPEGVKIISEEAFKYCYGLETVNLPKSVILIGEDAFYSDTNITTVNYGGSKAEYDALRANIGKYNYYITEGIDDGTVTLNTVEVDLAAEAAAKAAAEKAAAEAAAKAAAEQAAAEAAAKAAAEKAAADKAAAEKAAAEKAAAAKAKLAVPANVKAKKGKKAFTLTWKKVAGVTGYQIQYSTDKKFKNKKATKTVNVKGAKTTKKTVSKLKGGKKYYVRIRTYKGKNTSKWSKTFTVTPKK